MNLHSRQPWQHDNSEPDGKQNEEKTYFCIKCIIILISNTD